VAGSDAAGHPSLLSFCTDHPRTQRIMRASAWTVLCVLLLTPTALAEELLAEPPTHVLELEGLRVQFHVQSLFRVDGSFGPVSGEVRFAPEGGVMSGELRLDAATADTGYGLRDSVIREEVLETDRYPVIAFRPTRWRVRGRSATQLSAAIEGSVVMHGVERPVTVELEAQIAPTGEARLRGGLALEFEDWGIENPGTEFLPVDPRVGVTIEGLARSRPLASD